MSDNKHESKQPFSTTITIDDQKILDALETGGWGYWGFFEDGSPQWAELMNDGKSVRIGEIGGGEIVLDRAAIQRGIAAMVTEELDRLVEIIHEECDGETCDVLVQYACFGEVRYS